MIRNAVVTATFAAAVLLPVLAATPAQQAAPAEPNKNLPAGDGRALLVQDCAGCHQLSVVTTQHKSESAWTDTVVEMRNRGAAGSDDDMEHIIRYLTTNFGPQGSAATTAHINVNAAAAADLASGLALSQSDADAIVAFRDKNGKFKDLAALKQVPGIDTAKLDAAKDHIDF